MQQAGALEADINLCIRLITGMTTEQWQSAEWTQQLQDYDAVVMTYQILYNALEGGFLKASARSL